MTQRRRFLSSGVAAAVAAAAVGRAAMAALPEPVLQTRPDTMPPLVPPDGRPYDPVVTLNGWTLPWRMNAGVKEFHLVAEPVVREMAPGFKAHLWGYNGQSPGPTIEVVEGDRVRIFVTNRLPEHTSIHWHGQRLPNGMDGVSGLTQKSIRPGKTFVYEFVARRPGTFMYHPHADEMTQMAMGMMGFWITHPRARHPLIERVDRDFVFLLNAYDIDPGSYTPKIMTMLDFNLWSWNSRVFPGIDPLVVRKNDKVRIRIGNLTMTNHPIHLHGHEFVVTGTDGGPTPQSTRWHEVTTDVAVGQMRQIEFLADEEPSHDERDGPWGADHDRRGSPRRGPADRLADPRVHGDGRARDGRHGRDDDAAAGQYRADDDRRGAVRIGGDGRHVQRAEGACRAEAGRLRRPGLVPASAGYGRLRVRRRVAGAVPVRGRGAGRDACGQHARQGHRGAGPQARGGRRACGP
jgi:FtsP/CotA-like multicopper oxidase with cupredoxin domain